MNLAGLAEQATAAALRLRVGHGLGLATPICPYDLALGMGVEVRFVRIPSLEGIYRAGPSPVIVLNSLRPAGRRTYTCAHEIGHMVLGHGSRLDELLEDGERAFDQDEYAADRFAAALLMPKTAVAAAFSALGRVPASATPVDIFALAGRLGVGYRTLVGYLERTLRMLTPSQAAELRQQSPKAIRRELLGADVERGLVLIDQSWAGRPIDAEVGDALLVRGFRAAVGGCVLVEHGGEQAVIGAARPGQVLRRSVVDVRLGWFTPAG